MRTRKFGLLLIVSALNVAAISAQETFPPPEIPPEIGAARASGVIRVDGVLDEEDWRGASSVSGFRQTEPNQGNPATFDTEVRVLYDDTHIYIGAHCADPAGRGGVRVPDLRRDFNFLSSDLFGVIIDGFGDGRFSLVFQVNPLGAQRDQTVVDGQFFDLDWDGVWASATAWTSEGWSVEMAIPWTTLRYSEADDWKINFVRKVRRLNETTGWSLWPRVFSPYRIAYAGRLTELKPPPPARNVRLQPYTVLREAKIGTESPGMDLEPGLDLKWAISPTSVVDITVNTDFAQAEVDRQVVNLSRFSLFFPEKRPFFLENANLFSVGVTAIVRPFFSRRIGLDAFGGVVPIEGGVRGITRNTDRSAGGMLIRTERQGDQPASTFAVGRYIRNLGKTGRVGGMVISRSDDSASGVTGGNNTVLIADGFFQPSSSLTIEPMISLSRSSGGKEGFAASYWVGHSTNRGYTGIIGGVVSENYEASVGFTPRRDTILTGPGIWRDLRPAWKPDSIRKFRPAAYGYIYTRASDFELQEAYFPLTPLHVIFENSTEVKLTLEPNWQSLERPFSPLPGLRVETGDYRFVRYGTTFTSDQSRKYSGEVRLMRGGYYDGELDTWGATVRGAASPRASLALSFDRNVLRGIGQAEESRTTDLIAPEIRLALNPDVQLVAFYQHNTAAERGALNARFSWQFRPLSFIHLIYNEGRQLDLENRHLPLFESERQIVLKVSYLRQM